MSWGASKEGSKLGQSVKGNEWGWKMELMNRGRGDCEEFSAQRREAEGDHESQTRERERLYERVSRFMFYLGFLQVMLFFRSRLLACFWYLVSVLYLV